MSGPAPPFDLGEDIWHYAGEPEDFPFLADRYRFLNELWLPAICDELSEAQIAVISRFRERRFIKDGQFKQATASRRVLIELLSTQNFVRVLEIGCGKFPLAREIEGLVHYRGIDIDSEAIEQCRSDGLEVGRLGDLPIPTPPFDVAVALYVFQFAIGDDLLAYVAASLREVGSCIVFNAIADDSTVLLGKLVTLSSYWPVLEIVKSPALARREFFFVVGSEASFAVVHQTANALRAILSR